MFSLLGHQYKQQFSYQPGLGGLFQKCQFLMLLCSCLQGALRLSNVGYAAFTGKSVSFDLRLKYMDRSKIHPVYSRGYTNCSNNSVREISSIMNRRNSDHLFRLSESDPAFLRKSEREKISKLTIPDRETSQLSRPFVVFKLITVFSKLLTNDVIVKNEVRMQTT